MGRILETYLKILFSLIFIINRQQNCNNLSIHNKDNATWTILTLQEI